MLRMAYNKVVYGGKTLMDLTGDSVTPDKLLAGETAHDKSGETIAGTCTFDVDSTDATVTADEILKGKTGYARGSKVTGTMLNHGAVAGTISGKDDSYVVPVGYHDGSGIVEIDETEKAKLVPGNIRSGVTVLGVEGNMTGTEDVNAQTKTVSPTTVQQTILPDEGYNYLSQIVVGAIPYVESSNSAGGTTVTIAG
jgi:hypothetical protein